MKIQENVSRTFDLGSYGEPMVALFRMVVKEKDSSKEMKSKYGYLEFSIDGGIATHHDFSGFNYLGDGMFELPNCTCCGSNICLQVKIVTHNEAQQILEDENE